MAQQLTNPTRNHVDVVFCCCCLFRAAPEAFDLTQWVATSCGEGRRCGSDPALLWLWCRPVAAIAPIGPLAWELPYAINVALESKKKKKKEKKKKEKEIQQISVY